MHARLHAHEPERRAEPLLRTVHAPPREKHPHVAAAALRLPPTVVASEKGIVVGRLQFQEDGDEIDCSKVRPWARHPSLPSCAPVVRGASRGALSPRSHALAP